MSRLVPVGAAMAVAALATSAVAFALPQADALPPASAVHRSSVKEHTAYALGSIGYGSRVEGGLLPAASGTTAYQSIGCTNKSGLQRRNYAAAATLPKLGEIDGVSSKNFTDKTSGTIASVSQHGVAKVVLDLRTFGTLAITGITSESVASHSASGFHATTTTDIADIVLTPPVGPATEIAIPSVNHPVTIPGLLTLSLGHSVTSKTAKSAKASADGLDIDIIPSNTRIRIAHSAAKIGGGVTRGIFSGRANATQVRAVDDNVKSGPQPLTLLPCQGTDGQTRLKHVAETDIAGGAIVVQGASSGERAIQTAKKASAYEVARIAKVDLGNGQLVVNGIVAQVQGTRTKSGAKFDDKGTTIGSVTVGGKVYSLPDLDGLTIPGVAKIQTDVVKRGTHSIDVVALRLTLLDGTGAVVDLGHAFLNIRNSHL